VSANNPHHVLEVHPAWAFVSDNNINPSDTCDGRELFSNINN
jgi:hypothetical protein